MSFADRYSQALGGACLGGGLLGLADAGFLTLYTQASLSAIDGARLLALGLAAGLSAGLLAGAVLGLFLRPGRRALGVLLALAALGAFAIDALVYRNLYAEIHGVVGAVAAVCAAGAGASLIRWRWPAMLAVAAAVSLSLLVPALLSGDRLRQLVAQESTLTARVVGLLPAPDEAAVAVECVWPAPAPAPAGAPLARSVLVITIDALRADLGPIEQILPRTAARLGPLVTFPRAYAPATRTTSSSYALLTGRWLHNLAFRGAGADQNDNFIVFEKDDARLTDPARWKQRQSIPIEDTSPTLPGILAPAGFESFTAIPFLQLLPAAGVTREFDVVDEAPYRRHNRDDQREVSGTTTTNAALAWYAERRERSFVWLHYLDPHAPYFAFDVPAEAPDAVRYLSEVRRVDEEVDRLLAAVPLDETLVVLTSDHGEEFGDHGGAFHGTTVYEEQIRVPLWIRAPGLSARTVSQPVSLVDVAPTVVDLLGVQSDARFDGRSLRPALEGQTQPTRPILAESELDGRKVAVVDGDDKLVVDFSRRSLALYDLEADRRERVNLVDARPAEVEALRCLLLEAGVQRP